MRVVFFVQTTWAFGSLHFELCKYMHARGIIADVLDWRQQYTVEQMKLISDYYDYIITIPGESVILTDDYMVPHNKIIVVAHAEHDLRWTLRTRPPGEFDRFAGYGVISEFILRASAKLGIARVPTLVRIGINHSRFAVPLSKGLGVVGYGGALRREDHAGVDVKRGYLAREAAEVAGLTFLPADGLTFLAMPQYYSVVDVVIVTSLPHGEGCSLPGMEAAAAGRLVISTEAGYYPLLAESRSLGLVGPTDATEYKEFAIDTLRSYQSDTKRYLDACEVIREAAKKFDWQLAISDWVNLISQSSSYCDAGPLRSFISGQGRADVMMAANRLVPNGLFAEVGTFRANFAEQLFLNCKPRKLYCIDPYQSYDGYRDSINTLLLTDVYSEARSRMSRFGQDVEFLRKFSTDAAQEFQDGSLDFVYIDGNHSFTFVYADLCAWYPKVKIGGLICGDDAIDNNEGQRDAEGDVEFVWGTGADGAAIRGRYGVLKAVNLFCLERGITFVVSGSQFLINKRK